MKGYLLLVLLFISSTVNAIIIRDDTEDEEYRIPSSVLPALVDFPGEGHGILISPQWIVTAAHVACMQHFKEVNLNNEPRKVASVIVHPGYKAPDNKLIKEALATGNGSSLQEFIASTDDIALIKLENPITDVKPISLYRGDDEIGKIVQLIGKGSTGRGDAGPKANSPHRTTLRRAFNEISTVKDRWISYVFDTPKTAVKLEGMAGKGDSGSPVLINEDQEWKLAGIVAWDSSERDLRTYYGGRYGDAGYNVRVSYYIDWIENTISSGALVEDSIKD
ncbi:S1 family peptidase [Microbulbifer sp. SSSA002]|uniref:S1 family peptidase n=1 Tax=unclassified Microbulbifer TaxID=2619833 RepID=UPI004039E6A0